MVMGAGVLGLVGVVISLALFPCIFLLIVLASFIISDVASVTVSAFTNRVANWEMGWKVMTLASTKLL